MGNLLYKGKSLMGVDDEFSKNGIVYSDEYQVGNTILRDADTLGGAYEASDIASIINQVNSLKQPITLVDGNASNGYVLFQNKLNNIPLGVSFGGFSHGNGSGAFLCYRMSDQYLVIIYSGIVDAHDGSGVRVARYRGGTWSIV